MSTYTKVKGYGDTITCDDCNAIVDEWNTDETHAICDECVVNNG